MCIIRVLACIEDALASSATKKSKKPATTPNKRKPSPLSFAAILQHLSSLVAASNPTAVAPEFSLALRWALAVTDTDGMLVLELLCVFQFFCLCCMESLRCLSHSTIADGATETPEYLKSNGHVRYLRTECGVEVVCVVSPQCSPQSLCVCACDCSVRAFSTFFRGFVLCTRFFCISSFLHWNLFCASLCLWFIP